MHLFLTGAVGCGKSTAVNRTLALTGLSIGGFRTGFGPDRIKPGRRLYLWSAAGAPQYDEGHTVAYFQDGVPHPVPERFDALGPPLLAPGPCDLIVMDECGRLEQEALVFRRAVLSALDRETPVLGVVREGFPGWCRAVASHPSVTLFTVTVENRDELPALLAARLMCPEQRP